MQINHYQLQQASRQANANQNIPTYRLINGASTTHKVLIHIMGFNAKASVNALWIAKQLELIPPQHLVHLNDIQYIPSRRKWFAAFVTKKTGSPTSYVKKEHYSVEIYRSDNEQQLQWALYHEIAHFVFYKHLTPTLRKQWVTELYQQGGFVTDYAKTNGQEDFAESYACYLCDPQMLNRFPEKYLYMQQL
ncbi:MAG: putative zinc-binding metallopeptidase, partial [Pseudomonadales bacterium]|nr:putative zinc-binding metallopeptidase [Pseudomonadales bacterium]